MLFHSLLLAVAFAAASSRRINGGSTFPIFIRLHEGELRPLDVPSDSTVGDVIRFARAAGLNQIRALSFGGQRLADHSVQLADAGIGSEAVLEEFRKPSKE